MGYLQVLCKAPKKETVKTLLKQYTRHVLALTTQSKSCLKGYPSLTCQPPHTHFFTSLHQHLAPINMTCLHHRLQSTDCMPQMSLTVCPRWAWLYAPDEPDCMSQMSLNGLQGGGEKTQSGQRIRDPKRYMRGGCEICKSQTGVWQAPFETLCSLWGTL